MERTRPLPPPSLLPCKRPLPWYKSDPVVEPPPKRVRVKPPPKCVRVKPPPKRVHVEPPPKHEDVVMNDLTPVDPSTGVPQLEQKTPDNQGEPEAEAPDSQNDRREVVASVLVPEQLTEVHHEPEQETEELVQPNVPMVNSLTGALREAGRESENIDTENDGQEVARVVQVPQHKNGARLAPQVQAADGQGAEGQAETAVAQENKLEVLTPTALEESQRPDAVEVVNAIGPPELELNMEVARATGGGATILTSEPQKPQRSSERRSAMTREHISAPETNFGTIDDRVAVMKEEYVKTSDELVHNVPSPLNFVLCTLTFVVKWLKAVDTRRQSLEKSRVALHKLCRTELHNSSPGIVVLAMLEFQVNNDLCDADDKTKAETLHSTLVEMVEGLCADFPGRCAETQAALKWQPITENAIISAEVSSSESFGRLSQSAVDMISSQASDVIRDINQYERTSMDQIINRMRQTGQNARALVEQQTKESDARFIEKLNSSQCERRGSHSNNYFSQSCGERASQETKQAASKQCKVRDQQTEAANQTATPEDEGLTMQQQQREAAEVRVELEQQQKRQEEGLRLWQRCDKPQQLKRQQWEEQTATKQRQEQEAANEDWHTILRPFLQKERERLEQEAANQEHERERLEQEVANQEHDRERLARHHQGHEADDLDRQNQEAANEERERLAQQRRQTQQITKSFQSFASSHGILANVSASFRNLRQEKHLRLENRDRHSAEAPSGQPEDLSVSWSRKPHRSPEHMDTIIEEELSGQPEPSQPPENMDTDLDKGPSGPPEPSRPPENMDMDLDEGPSGQPEVSSYDRESPPDFLITWTRIPTKGRQVSLRVSSYDRESPPDLLITWTRIPTKGRWVSPRKPPGPPHPSGGVTDSSHRNSSSAGLDHLSELSAAIDRNTKMVEQNTKTVELALSQMLHLQRTANTSSTRKDQDEDLDEDSPAPTRKRRKFRAPARKTIHRDPDQLGCRSLAVLTLVLKERVRKHMNTMMGRPHRTSAPPKSAPNEAVLKYNESLDNKDGPSKVQFRADLSTERPVNGPWNDRLFEIFLVDYARKHSDDNVKDLSTYFMTYLQTLQTTCRKMKTTEGKSTYEVNLRRSRIEKRKKTALDKMSHAVLSDDESDHENGTNLGQGHYAIVGEVWRSDELIKWLRLMDLLACGEKWDGRNVARQGNSRHLRLHSSRSKDGVAVSGLPENCYNPDWLNSLKRYERELLDVQPPLDMQFSDEERWRAATYIPLANGEARPSSEDANTSGLDEWLVNMFGKLQTQRPD
ncbi:hypothetical protein EDB85DRAFT_1898380 [Lactarius pseudohatsudake]|nr:hypothetical protein EDB85DRAFT_1898380 [Lactarius pseudohatsudake]